MVFENRIQYDKVSIRALVEVNSRAPLYRRQFLIRRAILLAVGLLALICGGLLTLFFGEIDTYSRAVCVLNLILGVLLLGKGAFYRRTMVRRVLRSASGGERRVLFTEEEIQVELPGVQKTAFYYPALAAVYETEGYFVLPMSTKTSVIVDKGGFTQGTVAEFRDFIQRRTGKTARFIG